MGHNLHRSLLYSAHFLHSVIQTQIEILIYPTFWSSYGCLSTAMTERLLYHVHISFTKYFFSPCALFGANISTPTWVTGRRQHPQLLITQLSCSAMKDCATNKQQEMDVALVLSRTGFWKDVIKLVGVF